MSRGRKRKGLSLRAIRAYGRRNANLKKLGFDSYLEYRKSALWKSIRARVTEGGPLCTVCCEKLADQVHHEQYDLKTLRGQDLTHLVAICGDCHQASEFTAKGKCAPRQANSRQAWLKGMLRRQRWQQDSFHLPNEQFFKGR